MNEQRDVCMWGILGGSPKSGKLNVNQLTVMLAPDASILAKWLTTEPDDSVVSDFWGTLYLQAIWS